MKIFIVLLAAGLLPAEEAAPKPPEPKKAVAEAAKQVAKVVSVAAAPKAPKGESLRYNVNWPSGLSLGEAELTASPTESALNFMFRMDASVPGFAVTETANSRATKDYCSLELNKKGTRGKRKIDEKTEFDSARMKANRSTEGGGKSELSISPCAKDAVTFINFIRRELAAGRLPAQQKVYYGGAYSVRVTFAGTQRIVVGGEPAETDKLLAAIKGPASELTAELFFAKDAARTPLLVQVPLTMGRFSMELVR
jgi:hypothetical protein